MNDALTHIKPLVIATDGSANPNPGPGGWAWIDEHGNYQQGSFAHGTNNIAELLAIKNAIVENFNEEALRIQYDSQYAHGCITTWGPNWLRTGKKNKANYDLIVSIIELVDSYPGIIEWEWVRGHNGHYLNGYADQLAGNAYRDCDPTIMFTRGHLTL